MALFGIQDSELDLAAQPSTSTGITGAFDLTRQAPTTTQQPSGLFGVETPQVDTQVPMDRGAGLEGLATPTQAMEQVQAPEVDTEKSFLSDAAGVATQAGKSILDEVLSNLQKAAVVDYQSELSKWQQTAKEWFDPASDVAPTLDDYLSGIPDPTAALTESTLSGGELSEGGTLGEVGLGIGTLGISQAFEDQEQAEFIWNKGGEGAAEGALSGGWVGAIVGGVVGVVEGALTWASAEEDKEKSIQEAMGEYEKRYNKWLETRKLKAKLGTQQLQQQLKARQEAQAQQVETQQQAAANTKKQGMMNTINTLGKGVLR